ncbi:EAL and HDOD domain-containing protein [Fundidesulfovibrio soli]|uniref:EAL and HDOD domain-containing protein n=1 Tax=Fundidesulfovibrio soli TaxID=2922716 RepID=UPI001FB04ACE|nr:HDOD domain-containing protein [Fundidesulfovibrio soli]
MIIVANEVSDPICVARQPIYDADGNVFGYELLFRHDVGATSYFSKDANLATQKVIADGFLLAHTGPFHNTSRFFINFTEQLLMEDFAYALPPKKAVVEILERIEPTEKVLAKCRELKSQGYTLAIDDYAGDSRLAAYMDVVDIIKFDVLGKSNQEIYEMARPFLRRNITMLAEKVESAEVMQYTKSLGFKLFQGFYFSRPEMISGKKISSNDSSRIRILSELCNDDINFDRITCIISSDVSLTYRLLRFLNSATFGYNVKIGSIERAATVLGTKKLRKWLMAAVLSDTKQSNKAVEASWLAVQRAFFLQILSNRLHLHMTADELFLAGLFSKIDAIFDKPIAKILAELPLANNVKRAILEPGNPCRNILEFLDHIDGGDWDSTEKAASTLNLNVKHVGDAYLEAIRHSSELMSETPLCQPDDGNVELF